MPKVGGERLAKNPSSRGRSSIPPLHPVNPAPRSCRVHRRGGPPCRGPPSPRGQVGGTETHRHRKTSAPASAPEFSPLISPVFSLSGTRVPVGFPACGRTLPPLIARPPSSLFLSGGLRAHPGPRSRTPRSMKVCRGSGCRRGGGQVTVAGSGGPRAPGIKQNPPCRVFRRRRPKGSSPPDRVAPPVATVLLAVPADSSPREMTLDDVAAR